MRAGNKMTNENKEDKGVLEILSLDLLSPATMGVFFWTMVITSSCHEDKLAKQKGLYEDQLKAQHVVNVNIEDRNSDNLGDVVLKYDSGDSTVFYKTNNGYFTGEQIKEEAISKVKDDYQKQLELVNDSIDSKVGGGE